MRPRNTLAKESTPGDSDGRVPKLRFEKHYPTWTGFTGTEESLTLEENVLGVNILSQVLFKGTVLHGDGSVTTGESKTYQD